MPIAEIIPNPPPPPPIDYERIALIKSISEFICEDNREVRLSIQKRLENHTLEELRDFQQKHSVPIEII